jgi:hypothetical protein
MLLKASIVFCSIVFFIGVVLSALSCTILLHNMRDRDLEPIGHKNWFEDGKTFVPSSPIIGIHEISSPQNVDKMPPNGRKKSPRGNEKDFAALESAAGRSII